MVTPRISYAHLRSPSRTLSTSKAYSSSLRTAAPQRGTGGFGVEIEHPPVHNSETTPP